MSGGSRRFARRDFLKGGALTGGGLLAAMAPGDPRLLANTPTSHPPSPPRSCSCDTFVALKDVTLTGTTILAKNSDRPEYDCQPLVTQPGARHESKAQLQLEYISIPQVSTTYATVGSQPYWCWGYEEGFNEHGVAIGNEAIFTKTYTENVAASRDGHPPPRGLLGMDLLRLGLERGRTAREALDVITRLVSRYGQWGSGVPTLADEAGGYDNSYIIADPHEAWVLETVGTRWVARRFTSGVAAISNEPSIRTRWDLASPDLVDYAVDKGWWPKNRRSEFDFALAYIDLKTPLQLSHIRVQRVRQLLEQKRHGQISPAWMMRILRDHYESTFLEGPYFNAALPDFLTICMHDSPAGFTWGNTASSAVFELPADPGRRAQLWWSPVTPCTGLYLPVFAGCKSLPETLSSAGPQGGRVTPPPKALRDSFSSKSYWWLFRDLLKAIKGDSIGSSFKQRQPIVRTAFDKLERRWHDESEQAQRDAASLVRAGRTGDAGRRLDALTASCVTTAVEAVGELKRRLRG